MHRSARAACSKALPWLPVALAAAFAIACSNASDDPGDGGTPPSSCVSAPSCPAQVPSYKTEILPILQQACITCHSPDGSAGRPENTYAEVYSQRGSILSQVAICQMPPLNGPVMSNAQRVALTAWLKCGAPNN